jgi:hypothetical protein
MRQDKIFRTVRFLRYWVLRGAGRRYQEGETAELVDWLALKMVLDGVAEFVR